jgi:hypothetical protein
MEITMDLIRCAASFRLDSFNCRSGPPGDCHRGRITPPPNRETQDQNGISPRQFKGGGEIQA